MLWFVTDVSPCMWNVLYRKQQDSVSQQSQQLLVQPIDIVLPSVATVHCTGYRNTAQLIGPISSFLNCVLNIGT
jgi:hypothetical protein